MNKLWTKNVMLSRNRLKKGQFTKLIEAFNIVIMLVLVSLIAVHSKARAQSFLNPSLNAFGFIQGTKDQFAPTPRLEFIKNYNAYKVFKIHLQQLKSEDRIRYFHQNVATPEEFIIIDKGQQVATFFDSQAKPYRRVRVKIAQGDELTAGGSGIYRATSWSTNVQSLIAEKDRRIRPQLQVSTPLGSGTLVYILPTTQDHQFYVRDSQLTFMAYQVKRNLKSYNYSPVSIERTKIQFRRDPRNDFLNRYMKALEDEKAKLMSLTGIEDDEYNSYAELALGILAPETQNGESLKYTLKEMAPWLVSLLKGNGFDTNENSRGPTQIKKIPQIIIDHYQLDKSDLAEPENAAITTLVFVAELARDLRNIAHLHPKVNEFNLIEYIYYLYQGRRSAITKATATPEQSLNIKKILSQANRYPLTRDLLLD